MVDEKPFTRTSIINNHGAYFLRLKVITFVFYKCHLNILFLLTALILII